MPTYTEYLTIQTNQPQEIRPITAEVKAALAKSGFREGAVVVGSLHIDSAVILGLDDKLFFEGLQAWLETLAPLRNDSQLGRKFESNIGAIFRTLLLHPHVAIPFSEGRLDLGPWQEVLYAESEGQRPKRVVIKVIGE
jgi:secondary thiamine-phosphate synthase enzyme